MQNHASNTRSQIADLLRGFQRKHSLATPTTKVSYVPPALSRSTGERFVAECDAPSVHSAPLTSAQSAVVTTLPVRAPKGAPLAQNMGDTLFQHWDAPSVGKSGCVGTVQPFGRAQMPQIHVGVRVEIG